MLTFVSKNNEKLKNDLARRKIDPYLVYLTRRLARLASSRDRCSPDLEHTQLKNNFNILSKQASQSDVELKNLRDKNYDLTNQSILDQSRFEVISSENKQLKHNYELLLDQAADKRREINEILKEKDLLNKQYDLRGFL